MHGPPVTESRGRPWGEIAFNLVLTAAGGGMVWLAAAQVPRELWGMWVLIGYTALASALTLVLAVVQAVVQPRPVLQPRMHEARTAWHVAAWAVPWWYAAAIDLGLALCAAALLLAGAAAGGELLWVGLAVGLVGLWFGVRVALTLLGRRSRPTLWLHPEELVFADSRGQVRAARRRVRKVSARRRQVVLELEGPVEFGGCPRPWRGRGPGTTDVLRLDCSDIGHEPVVLARWIDKYWVGGGSED